MRKVILSAVIGLIAASMAIPCGAASVPSTQFIPAESAKLDSSAISVVSDDGAIGKKALTCTTKADDASGEGFTLTFTVDKAGAYTIWGRVLYPSISNNSIFYSIDGGDSMIWDFPDEDDAATACYNSWQYFYLTYREKGTYSDTKLYGDFTIKNSEWRHAPNVLTLSKGSHSIHFAGRETGWYLDEFVITELSIADYDPNAFDGNTNILATCKFCGTDWKHYTKDIYAVKGITAESYYHDTLYPAGDASADVSASPATADGVSVTVAATCLALAASGLVWVRKKFNLI